MLVADLRELTFLDSTGVRVLLTADLQAKERGVRFGVARNDGMVRRLLDVTRIEQRFPVVDDPAELAAGRQGLRPPAKTAAGWDRLNRSSFDSTPRRRPSNELPLAPAERSTRPEFRLESHEMPVPTQPPLTFGAVFRPAQ